MFLPAVKVLKVHTTHDFLVSSQNTIFGWSETRVQRGNSSRASNTLKNWFLRAGKTRNSNATSIFFSIPSILIKKNFHRSAFHPSFVLLWTNFPFLNGQYFYRLNIFCYIQNIYLCVYFLAGLWKCWSKKYIRFLCNQSS